MNKQCYGKKQVFISCFLNFWQSDVYLNSERGRWDEWWRKNDNLFKIESHFVDFRLLCINVLDFSMLRLLDKLLSSSFSFSSLMRWTNEHDIMFLREVLVHQPWKHWYGSQERGKLWEKVAESLNGWNSVCELYFKVTQRSVRGWLSYFLTTLKNVSEKKLQQVEFLQRKHTNMLWLTSLNVPRKQIKCIRSKQIRKRMK